MEAHPEIISLIKKRDEIHFLLFNQHNYHDGLWHMLGIIQELQEKDQDTDLIGEITRDILIYEKNRSSSNNLKRAGNRSLVYAGYLRRINKILWDGGYLKNEKYGMGIIPTKTMKVETAPPTIKHYGEKLPSDLA
jgi:hypothetical protein